MKIIDISEKGLEIIIVNFLVNEVGYVLGDFKDYDREYVVDLVKLLEFLEIIQFDIYGVFGINREGFKCIQFLYWLQGEIVKWGVVDVLQIGIRYGFVYVEFFYGIFIFGNVKVVEWFSNNIFSVIC